MKKTDTIKVQIDLSLEEYESLASAAKGVGMLKSGSGHVQRLIRAVLAGRVGVDEEKVFDDPESWIAPIELADVLIGNPRWAERSKPTAIQGF